MKTFISPYVYAGLRKKYSHSKRALGSIRMDITNLVCKEFGYTFEEVDTKSRKREIVYVRHAIAYWNRSSTSLSLTDIGSIFTGLKDHATILNSCNAWADLVATDKSIREINNRISDKIIELFKK